MADRWGHILAQALGIKRESLPDPIQIPRPGIAKQRKPETNPHKIRKFFNRLKGGE